MIKEQYIIIKNYLSIINIRKLLLFLMFFVTLIYISLELLIPKIASLIIECVTDFEYIKVFDYVLVLLFCYLFYHIFLYLKYLLFTNSIKKIYSDLFDRITYKMFGLDEQFSDFMPYGTLSNIINKDLIHFGSMIYDISSLFSSVFKVLVILFIVYIIDINVGMIFLTFSGLYVYIKYRFDLHANTSKGTLKKILDKYCNVFTQVLDGLAEIKNFGMQGLMRDKLDEIIDDYDKEYRVIREYVLKNENDTKVLSYLFSIILIAISSFYILYGELSIAILVLLVGYFENLILSLDEIIFCTGAIRVKGVSINRVLSLCDYNSRKIISGNIFNKIDGKITFDDVNFSVDGELIIKKFNLEIKPNSLTVLSGIVGSGKSSILNLLLRTDILSSGCIYIDDVSLYQYDDLHLKHSISVVNQDPFVFHMSIKQNLSLYGGNYIEVCKLVGIHNFIMSLPLGYDTILVENGVNISGGQKKLLSLARALLINSKIIILDDITAYMDIKTLRLIVNLLSDLKKNHTIVVASNCSDIIEVCDQLVILEKGEIIGGYIND